MSLPNSILAYEDCESFFDAGLADEYSVRIRCETEAAAVLLRMRMNMFRKLDRQRNAETHEPGAFMHGRSEYDKFVLQIKQIGEEWWLCLTKSDPAPDRIVSMRDDDLLLEHKPMHQIAAPVLSQLTNMTDAAAELEILAKDDLVPHIPEQNTIKRRL